MTMQLTDAVAAARLARQRAERELRRSELERDQTARALELNLHPLDERQRETLRIAYADAAASVAVNADAFERAVEIEHATEVLSRAFDESPRTRQGNVLPFSGRSRWPSPDVRALLR